jgi:hypothetical protein
MFDLIRIAAAHISLSILYYYNISFNGRLASILKKKLLNFFRINLRFYNLFSTTIIEEFM